ncbi:MAG: cyclase family protein [Saprospiraceae bacterium]|nr:cyclase family protein [Saprospiraceae bacterium]
MKAEFIELNHLITDGMTTHRGLPGPQICDYFSHEESKKLYAPGTEFQIGRIDMLANTGTYLDTPFHRFRDGADLSEVGLEKLADLPAILIDARMWPNGIPPEVVIGRRLSGHAVLFLTGWDRYWGRESYLNGHPYLEAATAKFLVSQQVLLVGIDSHNIDDTSGKSRPVHTSLLGAGIPIVEHLCNLDQLSGKSFQFTATPPRVKGMGTFPVRAFAKINPER